MDKISRISRARLGVISYGDENQPLAQTWYPKYLQKLREAREATIRKVYVKNFPTKWYSNTFGNYFSSDANRVTDAYICRDHMVVSKGYGFLTYETEEQAVAVKQAFHGTWVEGLKLELSDAFNKRNMRWQITEEEFSV